MPNPDAQTEPEVGAREIPQLSISIVHHDGLEMLRGCLKSVAQFAPSVPYEVMVVDNASTDGAREMLAGEFPDVRVICRERRFGFGDNHNKAIQGTASPTLFLLNDDTLLTEGAIDELVRYMNAYPEAAVIGARLENADGSLQLSCYKFPSPLRCVVENLLLTALFPRSTAFGDYRTFSHDVVQKVEFVSGAAMLVRREAINVVGGFDSAFFMYAEETDWQYRMKRAGWKTVFCPTARIVHLGGASTEAMPERQFVEFNRSQALYIRKWYGVRGAVVQRVAMVFGAVLRIGLWSMIGMISPKRKRMAHETVQTWMRLLKWWAGFGSKQGLRELAEQTGKTS